MAHARGKRPLELHILVLNPAARGGRAVAAPRRRLVHRGVLPDGDAQSQRGRTSAALSASTAPIVPWQKFWKVSALAY